MRGLGEVSISSCPLRIPPLPPRPLVDLGRDEGLLEERGRRTSQHLVTESLVSGAISCCWQGVAVFAFHPKLLCGRETNPCDATPTAFARKCDAAPATGVAGQFDAATPTPSTSSGQRLVPSTGSEHRHALQREGIQIDQRCPCAAARRRSGRRNCNLRGQQERPILGILPWTAVERETGFGPAAICLVFRR